MASSEDEQIEEWLKSSQLDITATENKQIKELTLSMQNIKHFLATQVQANKNMFSRIQDLEDGLKVTQHDWNGTTMQGNKIKDE